MRIKRPWTIPLVVAVTAFLAVACGGGAINAPTAAPTVKPKRLRQRRRRLSPTASLPRRPPPRQRRQAPFKAALPAASGTYQRWTPKGPNRPWPWRPTAPPT